MKRFLIIFLFATFQTNFSAEEPMNFCHDEFLQKIREKLSNFPASQKHCLTDNADGKVAQKKLKKTLGLLVKHLKLKQFAFNPCDTSSKPMFTFEYPGSHSDDERDDQALIPQTLFCGNRSSYLIRDISYETRTQFYKNISGIQKNIFTEKDSAVAKGLAQEYKIHLMPLKPDIPVILYMFLKEFSTTFKDKISAFKFNMYQPEKYNPSSDERPNIPTIVIYPSLGKENAQLVLNQIYHLFKDFPGLQRAPRWNQKITDLIWWAQGDGDDKKECHYLFSPGDNAGNGRVTFRSDFEGENNDYSLKDPSTD